MAKSIKKRFTTNSRVLSELLTKYRNTFYAFSELITNSLQAKAKEIRISIDYAKGNSVSASPIKSMSIIDNGHGVPLSEFEDKVLEIGTVSKADGQGIGRFGALQIGSKVDIETVAWDERLKKFTKTSLPIDTDEFQQKGLKDVDLDYSEEILSGNQNPYYSVTIRNLHHGKQEKIAKKNKVVQELLKQNINLALFEKYPYEIFNSTATFYVNGKPLNRSEFINDKPKIKKVEYVNVKGEKTKINFYFYSIKLSTPKVKVFLQVESGGIKTVAHEYTYSSDWYSADLGTWFIYVESPSFSLDLFRNIDFEDMGDEELSKLKIFIKNTINDFFVSINQRFQKFTDKLKEDKYNPYKSSKPASESENYLFQKAAYLVEDEFKLLKKDDKIRSLIYPLINKALQDGNAKVIFQNVLKMDANSTEKFNDLLKKTELENVVHFASQVADHTEFLDFLHELVYGDIAKYVKERTELHKIVEHELWLFGEQYNGTAKLWSDRKIGKILDEIRRETLVYEPTAEDENLITLKGKGLNDITDLFFTNEKITDDGSKEYMIVELKAPKCAIGQKEINQIDRYAFTIEKHDALPSDKVKYKLYLISSKLHDYTKSKLEAAFEKYRIPFLYEKKAVKNIEIYITSWTELIENNRRKLNYLSRQLKVKDKSVKEKFENEYNELMNSKVRSVLKRIA